MKRGKIRSRKVGKGKNTASIEVLKHREKKEERQKRGSGRKGRWNEGRTRRKGKDKVKFKRQEEKGSEK